MSKVKDLAKELYPDWEMTGIPYIDGQEESMVRIQRAAYIKGYHQAEKDLELTLEDVRRICLIARDVHQFMGFWSDTVYEEVLKRFKAQKGEKV